MLIWKLGDHRADAETAFACLRAQPWGARYRADVCDAKLRMLSTRLDLPTLESAQAWCEDTYKALLRKELEG